MLTASVLTAGRLAELIMFRRIDPEQPNALAVNLDRVAVDDRGAADKSGHVPIRSS